MGARESKGQTSQNDILYTKFSITLPVFTILVKFDIYLTLITSITLENCKTKSAVWFKLFWYKVFVQ